LPQHILDQLIQSEAQSGWEESDDEDQTNGPSRPSKNMYVQQLQPNQILPQHRDAGISGFLSELKSAATATATPGVVEKKTPPQLARRVFESKVTATTSFDTQQNENSISSQSHVVEPISMKRMPISRLSHIDAAPRIVPPEAKPAPRTTDLIAAIPPTTTAANNNNNTTTQVKPSPSSSDATTSQQSNHNKRSRRAMEQALRSGNFAALGGDDQVSMVSLEAPAPDAYEPPDEHQSTTRPTHGVRVVPMKMYDPKAGADITAGQVSGKQRSKHQITQLMVSAAALEAKRARGMGGSDAGATHRADAKRKYGW
jgi:hypothetical protein